MTGMEHAIEQAAGVMWEAAKVDFGGVVERDCHVLARTLAEAGLLAPAPLREEWGTRFGDHVVEGRTDADYPFWFKGTPPRCENVHRHVADWAPADAVDRAEGDGKAGP